MGDVPGTTDIPPEVVALVDAAIDATAIVDEELRVIRCNRSYLMLAGVRAHEMRRTGLRAVCHERLTLQTCSEGPCVARRAFELKRPVRVDEVRSARNDLRVVVMAVPLLGRDGIPYAAVESYRDVTAESRMQDNYKQLLVRERERNVVLQEEVNRRTAELTHSLEELRAARAKLIQSEKMSSLGQLVAGIAHELNNPINYIYGNVDFLEQHAAKLFAFVQGIEELVLDATQRTELARRATQLDIDFVRRDLARLVGSMRDGAERVAAIVQDLRTFSHAGQVELKHVDLNRAVSAALNLVAVHAKERIRLVRELAPLPQVRCSAAQISQVVMNLVLNAIQAIDGDGKVEIRTRPGPEGVVEVEVEDDGKGMTPDVMGKMFDPFFTTKDVGKGTGLGLSISYGIVQSHGGRLDVESEPGEGTRVRFILPVDGPV